MGSVAAGRRGGTRQANAAATISSRVTPAKINGSRELSVTHFVAILSNATLSRRPAASPAPRLAAVGVSTKRKKTGGFWARGRRNAELIGRGAARYGDTPSRANAGEGVA